MATSSFALWSDNSEINIDLHINCWIFNNKRNAIDFGLMISKAKRGDKIYFYIPFKLKEEDISLLTETIHDSVPLRSIIFNENLKRYETGSDESPICKFFKRENTHIFSFCLNDYVYEEDYEGGVRLTFEVNGDPKEHETYFRFRLIDSTLGGIIESKKTQVSYLTGVEEEHINVEININQFRKLSNKLQSKVFESGTIFNRINMFLMADINLSPIFSTHSEKPKTRILEDAKKWSSYIKLDEETRYLAYQYKKEDKITKTSGEELITFFNDFTIFSKFERVISNKKILGYALATLILLGTFAGIFSGILVNIFSNSGEELQKIQENSVKTNTIVVNMQSAINEINDTLITSEDLILIENKITELLNITEILDYNFFNIKQNSSYPYYDFGVDRNITIDSKIYNFYKE